MADASLGNSLRKAKDKPLSTSNVRCTSVRAAFCNTICRSKTDAMRCQQL